MNFMMSQQNQHLTDKTNLHINPSSLIISPNESPKIKSDMACLEYKTMSFRSKYLFSNYIGYNTKDNRELMNEFNNHFKIHPQYSQQNQQSFRRLETFQNSNIDKNQFIQYLNLKMRSNKCKSSSFARQEISQKKLVRKMRQFYLDYFYRITDYKHNRAKKDFGLENLLTVCDQFVAKYFNETQLKLFGPSFAKSVSNMIAALNQSSHYIKPRDTLVPYIQNKSKDDPLDECKIRQIRIKQLAHMCEQVFYQYSKKKLYNLLKMPEFVFIFDHFLQKIYYVMPSKYKVDQLFFRQNQLSKEQTNDEMSQENQNIYAVIEEEPNSHQIQLVNQMLQSLDCDIFDSGETQMKPLNKRQTKQALKMASDISVACQQTSYPVQLDFLPIDEQNSSESRETGMNAFKISFIESLNVMRILTESLILDMLAQQSKIQEPTFTNQY